MTLQSCTASEYLEGLLLRALHDPSLSQQAAVLHQHRELRQNSVTTNAMSGPTMKAVSAKLHDGSTVRLPVFQITLNKISFHPSQKSADRYFENLFSLFKIIIVSAKIVVIYNLRLHRKLALCRYTIHEN